MGVTAGGRHRTIGLALSGGGFRASIFHLGVLRRLDELGVLRCIDDISSVSGGSLTAGLYCLMNPRTAAEFRGFEARLLRGIKRDPRKWWATFVVLFLGFALGIWSWAGWWAPVILVLVALMAPWGSIQLMARFFNGFFRLRSAPLGSATAPAPDAPPRLLINAACLNTGKTWIYSPGYIGPDPEQAWAPAPAASYADPARVTLAHAIGASACVPGIFYPYRLTLERPLALGGTSLDGVDIVDGGAYDNQGLAVHFTPDPGQPDRCAYLIGSDAAQVQEPRRSPFWRVPIISAPQVLFRTANMWADRAREEAYLILRRKRSASEVRQYAVFHMRSPKGNRPPFGLPERFGPVLAAIRTDLDAFSDLEIRTLMFHGYSLVNHRVTNYCWEILMERFPGVDALVRTKAPCAPDHEPFHWQELPGFPRPAGLPAMDDWAEFNRKLTRDHGDILTDRAWDTFLATADFDDPASGPAVERALQYLKRSSIRLDPLRALLRGYDRLRGR